MSDAQRRAATDGDLAHVAALGDRLALGELYSRHAGPCFALARRVLADRVLAEEVVQEVFLRLWRRPERFDANRGSMRSFLFAQVHGRSVDLLRAETARRAREQREAFRSPTVDIDLERAVAELSEGEAVRRALADLSEGERGAIELAYFGGHTYREVAVLLELPEGTVKSRIRSGLLRLRAALIDAGVKE
jgi:RNA polymerase sigma-70 factor (ECF subfamily)